MLCSAGLCKRRIPTSRTHYPASFPRGIKAIHTSLQISLTNSLISSNLSTLQTTPAIPAMAFYSTTHCFSSPVWSTPPGAAFLSHVLPAMLGTTVVVQTQRLAPQCPQNQNTRAPQQNNRALQNNRPPKNVRFAPTPAPVPAARPRAAPVATRPVAPQQRDKRAPRDGRSAFVEPSREREREHGRRDSRTPHRDDHHRRAERPEDHRARRDDNVRQDDRRNDRNRHGNNRNRHDGDRNRHERDGNRDKRDGGGRRKESRCRLPGWLCGGKEPKQRDRDAAPRPAVREPERERRRDTQVNQPPRNAVGVAAQRAPRYHHSERARLDGARFDVYVTIH
ncbi:hypothetical protein BDW22DRAFT_1001698 [Trametopsis cervina]|nr:hypothetical protein BDW22DRAFT_1001698 [Trametopsis cervina]